MVHALTGGTHRAGGEQGRHLQGTFLGRPLQGPQSLLDDNAVLAAMAYVDLNPVRAKICDTLEASAHTNPRKAYSKHEPA